MGAYRFWRDLGYALGALISRVVAVPKIYLSAVSIGKASTKREGSAATNSPISDDNAEKVRMSHKYLFAMNW